VTYRPSRSLTLYALASGLRFRNFVSVSMLTPQFDTMIIKAHKNRYNPRIY
jgi:hypothetical protein